VVAGRGLQHVEEGNGARSCIAAGATAAYDQALPVDQPALHQVTRAVDAIFNVSDAPVVAEALAVGAAVAGAPAVIDVEDSKAAARPVLAIQAQVGGGRRSWAAVTGHDERRQLPGRKIGRASCRDSVSVGG